MTQAREIKTQIASIQNTKKVTGALEMVSASKIRKAQERMEASRPYARMMAKVLGHMAHAELEYRHPYLIEREPRNAGFVIISTDRGLCGGLNSNLFRNVVTRMREFENDQAGIEAVTVGSKAAQFFARAGVKIQGQATNLGDRPRVEDLVGVIKVMLEAYDEGEIDRLYLCYNHFVNTMSQEPRVEQLLPVVPAENQEELLDTWDYIYEPDAPELMEDILVRYIESQVYQGAMENVASEHAARMVAMKSASDNAEQLTEELQLVYNKARQAAITQEISEIVSGAAAV